MLIIARLSQKGKPVADVTYRAGMHVEVRVAKDYRSKKIDFVISHDENQSLKGLWEKALDSYFNEWAFDSRRYVFPGEMARFGAAREHKSLFRTAAMQLKKDLAAYGFSLDVEFS